MAETGIEFPLVEASAEDVPLPDAIVRPRRLGVRREHLVRPGALAARGGAAASAGRATRLPAETARSRCCAFPTSQAPRRSSCCARSGTCTGSAGRSRTASSSTPDTAISIDLLHAAGFEVERLVELYAPAGARTHEYYDTATPEWASKWPAEELWVARKTG